jgi:assimilatory nitrate reductase catalytic subunit
LSGDIAAEAWLRDWLTAGHDVARLRAQLLVPATSAPRGFRIRGRIVCNCHDVAESDIASAIAGCDAAPAAVLATLQESLRCGTNCGSCCRSCAN